MSRWLARRQDNRRRWKTTPTATDTTNIEVQRVDICPIMDCKGVMVKIKYFQRHTVFERPQILVIRESENWGVRATIGQRESQSEYSFYLLTGERLGSVMGFKDIMGQDQHEATLRESFVKRLYGLPGWAYWVRCVWILKSEFALLSHTACTPQVRVFM